MSDGPVFVEWIDLDAAAEAVHQVRDPEGKIPQDKFCRVLATAAINAALVGVRPAEGVRVAGPDDLLIRREDIAQVVALVEEQAENEGLWFIARTAPEAYLQQELRRLHAVIESALAAAEGEE